MSNEEKIEDGDEKKELLEKPEFSRGDLKQMARAAELGWEIPADAKEALVKKLTEMIPTAKVRSLISIGRLLAALNEQNIELTRPAPPRQGGTAIQILAGGALPTGLTEEQIRAIAAGKIESAGGGAGK